MDTQREALRDHFAERLFALEPSSLLDIGAGAGNLVRRARERGLYAVGLELEAPPVPPGPPVAWVRASAAHLPFESASFDWVSLRHVPHHLPDLGSALGEAWRVARAGLVIAEPWFDETCADQRFALRADRWLKRMDRRSGRFHADVLSADALRAHLPGQPQGKVETYRPQRPWSVADLEYEAQRATDGLTPDPEDQRELDSLLDVARRGRMTLNGTLILTIEKG
ncbi:MAG: SAM-dependent methyltransferase [Planctomycetota bacterium]|jgi:SAM-dependent methyltransferase